MDRNPPTYIELTMDEDEEEATHNIWFDEKTIRIDFERPVLSSEEKLVFGYLTMEQHGMFAGLSFAEQQAVAKTLKG
jgi:hypothetical protein